MSRSVTLDANYLAECANYLVNNISTIDVTATTYAIEGYGEVIDNSGTWTGEPIASGGAWQTAGDRVYLDNKYAEITDDGSQPLLTLRSNSSFALPVLKMVADYPDNDGRGIIQFSNHDGSSIHEMRVTQDQWNFRGGSIEYNFRGGSFNYNGDLFNIKGVSNIFPPKISMIAGAPTTAGMGTILFKNYDGSSIYTMEVTDDQWNFTAPGTAFNFTGYTFNFAGSAFRAVFNEYRAANFLVDQQSSTDNLNAEFLSRRSINLRLTAGEDCWSDLIFCEIDSSQSKIDKAVIRYHGSSESLEFYNYGSGDTIFHNKYGSGDTIIETNGLGINTYSPKGTLDVNGSIYQRGTLLHAKRALGKDTSLESIAEHAENMWREQRLPAVPAPEILEDGREAVELGEQRRGMLEELEKAHIYIQQLHQHYQALQQKLEQQNKMLQQRIEKLEAKVN